MHELSIALSILDIAAEEAQRRGAARITAVHLRLGPLSGVIKEALLSAYELASEGSPLQDSRLVVEEVALVVYCPHCGAPRRAISPQEICCCECGTPAPEVISGRELEVVAMEVLE
jgi:hydrogenase nickel incorporation protein HypA/HybF